MNEAQEYAQDDDLLRDAIAGDLLMITGVSNRLLSIGGDVHEDFRVKWHAIFRRIDGELIHELIFEPEETGTPVGIKHVLRRSSMEAMFD
ncbi:MAG: hypothetical protein ACNA7O_18330 [Rhodobacterales bacterium]